MLNNCTFQGRFAADPEMRTTQSGLTVASFRMAVDRDNVGQDGRRATDWLNFVAWRKTAEFVCQYFRKGSTALVECQSQNQRQQWQQSAPGGQQPSYSQGDPDDFSVIDDSDDLPF